MANRYWVGGTNSWNATAGTKWSATSGGAGGASVPTAADDVFFDANSGAVTVSLTTNVSCLSLNFTGFTGTFAQGSLTISIGRSLTAAATMTWTGTTGTVNFNAASGSYNITTNGKTIPASVVIGSSSSTSTWTLGSALVCTGSLTVTFGTFTTNNYNVTATVLASSNTNTRTINLGSSTVTLSASSGISCSTSTGLTFNAGTSTIVMNGSGGGTIIIGTPGAAFYNISGTYTAGATSYTLIGVNSANNISIAAPAVAGVSSCIFSNRCTINGTLSTSGTAGNRRVWFRGSTYGLAQTLTVNSAPSLTDADFRDIYVVGTAAPISGTRIGDLRGNRGITFSTPKTVYWVTAGGGNWSGTNWAATSGGAASTNNFPLAQDTAVIENTGLNTSATVTMDTAITNIGSVDMSTRTNAMTFSNFGSATCYGDLTAGSGTSFSSANTFTLSGRNIQTITSAGKSFVWSFVVDSYDGTVQLGDALSTTGNFTVTNGTFDTKNYNVTAGSLASANTNIRAISLGSSTLTISSPLSFSTPTNFTFNAGTSQINFPGVGGTFNGGGFTFYNVTFTSTTATSSTTTINSANTFNNLTISAPSSAGLIPFLLGANQTINGTLTVAGASAVRRVFLQSDTLGTTRTLTVNSLSADDCDFRDITIAGAAAGSSPTRAGDCGGNTGITFPAPKTVYWNLAGTQNWSATGWASSSGGSPAVNNFPLAQDTAVFDNVGAAGTVTIETAWKIGTFDASARTSAMTLSTSTNTPFVYGDWKFGTGVTSSSTTGTITFSKRSTQTITSNGVQFACPVTIDSFTGTVQLADALIIGSTRTLTLTSGTFDAVSYNVTTGLFSSSSPPPTGGTKNMNMGSGTWTLSGTGTIWYVNFYSGTFNKGTANIVLSDTSTSARIFRNEGQYVYNKLTIGGATGTSNTTIDSGSFSTGGVFLELASTKTVAHTITIGTSGIGTLSVGKWSVTGTAGNVVTVVNGSTAAYIEVVGPAVSGVDYLAMNTVALSTTSPGEFYAGANSTGTGSGITLTAAPAGRTLYWVGGTGNWSSTTKWSTSSGGASGAAIPTSLDDVIFDSASNATAYTATIDPIQARCKSLTIAGPASGNVTIAGTGGLATHGSVSLSATGITRTYTGTITLSSSSTGLTFTTNGNTLASPIEVNGVSCGWTLGSALDIGTSAVTLVNGTFDTGNYNVTADSIGLSTDESQVVVNLGSSTLSLSGTSPLFFWISPNTTLNAGTSTISISSTTPTIYGGNLTFYNVSYTSTSLNTVTLNHANTFNNLSFAGVILAGLRTISITANQTINGTLTFSAGTNATMRQFVKSDTFGSTRTLTCAAFSGTDVDFQDITITGAAAPVSGTRLGDCKGNSGITFDAPKTVYYNAANGVSWNNLVIWALSPGGAVSGNNFPLAQDTVVFTSTEPTSGQTITINANYNIGTIDMSARTSNTMTLATSTNTPTIYGNWINGTGTTLTGTGTLTFAGRGSQTITSAGKTWTQAFNINSPGGSVTLQDAFSTSNSSGPVFTVTAGTFDASSYNVTFTSTGSGTLFQTSGTITKTVAFGSGTWTLAGYGSTFNLGAITNLTVTGTGTISLTSALAKTFAGGGLSYSGITLNQGGAGTLTITGNNTFKNITNSYSATGATNITLGTTTQTVTQFTATGTSGKVLTVQGTSSSSPGTLVLTSGTVSAPDYLTITGVRAYNLTDTWYAGANSTNNGSLGWYFSAYTPVVTSTGNFFLMFG